MSNSTTIENNSSAAGGEEIEYQTSETAVKDSDQIKHSDLYVLIHGLHGNRQDFQFIAQKLKELYNCDDHSEHAIIIDCACNEGKTSEGIESLGMNVLHEVLKILYERKVSFLNNGQKLKLSVVGHSLGGLIGRYFIKVLFDLPNCEMVGDEFTKHRNYFLENIFPYLIPCSFTTISTPHLGSRRPGGGSYFGSAYRVAAHSFLTVLGKTGRQLILNDGHSIEKSLLYKMSLPDSDYVKALKMFPYRTLISSCHLDSTVPFPSASIRSFNPYKIKEYGEPSMVIGGASVEFLNSPEYISLFSDFFTKRGKESDLEERIETLKKASWKGTEIEPFKGELNDKHYNLYRDNFYEVEFEATMMKNLQDIKWRRIDIDFTVSSFLQAREIHVVVLRKKIPIIGGIQMDPCGERCVGLVTSLCKFDSDHFKL